MQPVQQPQLTPPDGIAVGRVLSPITIRIEADAALTCVALVAHAEQATELLLCTAVDAQHIPGRWRATRQGARLVYCELIEGPLPGLALSISAHDRDGASTLLQVEGSYTGPVKPLLERRRVQQLAEALRAGLVVGVQEAVASHSDARGEQRTEPRQMLALPVRLRVGDTPWEGVTRDVSIAGMGLLVRARPQEASALAAQIGTHSAGAVEVLLSECRLTARVRITRAEACPAGINVGLRYGTPTEGTRLRQRLTALDLWQEPTDGGVR